jgi:ubiquinone/menaquinone biosynthesis C-methylase UbiE
MGSLLTGRPACFGSRYASAFRESSVADAYGFRPPYPPVVFEVLATLLPTRPCRILDVGCGTGALARRLISFGVPIDAVDVSPAMIARGRCLPNGTHSLIHWMVGAAEEVPLTPPYDLVTAGESVHWMEWETVLPRFNSVLSPDGRLVILELGHQPVPWDDQLARVIRQYSLNQAYQALDLVNELEQRGLLDVEGRHETAPWAFRQSVEDYVESFHGRASFARERMRPDRATDFDRAIRTLVAAYQSDLVELPVVATIAWGRPRRARQPGNR